MPSGAASCDTATSYSVCTSTEGGDNELLHFQCPQYQVCNAAVFGQPSPCGGGAAGSSCSLDAQCASNLRCVGGSCRGPTNADVALCNVATAVDLSHGSADANVVVGVDALELATRMIRPICADFDASVPELSRAAFVPIRGAEGDVVDIRFSDADVVNHVAVVTLVSCSDLYNEDPLIHSCSQQRAQLEPSLFFPKPSAPFALMLVMDSQTSVTSVHLQLGAP